MPTIRTRELSFTYGGVTIGGSSGREITGVAINTKKFEEFIFEAEFDIYKTTEATFASEIDTIEDAFAKPFQDFTVAQGSSTIYSFLQSSNTGLDAKPEITKREQNASGRSRRYGIRIVVGLPANTGAELVTGLREHNVQVAYDPARIRTVTVTGVFTASGGSNARSQYSAQIGSLESSVFSALSITAANRELIEEPQADHTYNTKTVSFRRVWRELIFSQAGSSNDDSAIKRQVLQISRKKEAPGDSPQGNVSRLATLEVGYDAWLDKDVSTDLRGKYSSIKGWILTQVSNTLGGGSIALTEETPNFIYDENRISVRMVVRGTTKGQFIERILQIADEYQPGWALVPAWTGDPLSKFDYPGPAIRRRTLTDTKVVPGIVYSEIGQNFSKGNDILSAAGLGKAKAPGLDARHVSSRAQYIHKKLGQDGYTFDVTEIVQVDVFDFFKPIINVAT